MVVLAGRRRHMILPAGGVRLEDNHHDAVVVVHLPNRLAAVGGLDDTVPGVGQVGHSSRLGYIGLEVDLEEHSSPAAVDCMEDSPDCLEEDQGGRSIAVAGDTLDHVEGIHRRVVDRMTFCV